MKRRHAASADSMDLLLDTITNTFGGVLLLALLLILLIRDFSESSLRRSASESEMAAEQKRLTQRIAQETARRDILRQSLTAQRMFDFGEDEQQKQALIEQLTRLAAETGRLQGDIARHSSDGAEQQRQLAEFVGKKESLKGEREQLKEELSAAEDSLKNELSARTRTMELPRETPTRKGQLWVIVKRNEMFLASASSAWWDDSYNADHFEAASSGKADLIQADGVAIRARVGNGVPLEPEPLTQYLAGLDGDQVFLEIAVTADSFEKFANLRTAMVQRSIQYRLHPEETLPIRLFRSSTPSSAQ